EGSLCAAYPFPFFGSARLFSQLGNAPQLAIQFRVLRIDAADRVPSCVGFFVFFRILQSAGFTDDSRQVCRQVADLGQLMLKPWFSRIAHETLFQDLASAVQS